MVRLLKTETPEVRPVVRTMPLPDDADDPAIWTHPRDPRLSLILGTNKARAPRGAIGVFDLSGRMLQRIDGIDQPNNIDVAYGFALGRERVDIAVATERYASRLRIFRIDPARRRLVDITDPDGARVFAGESGERAMPMGLALYQAGRGEVQAIVSRKSGPKRGYLHQYRLVPTRGGRVGVQLVRAFGAFSGEGEIEAICVDSELGYVYYADEGVGIRKYYADPRHPEREIALFATGLQGRPRRHRHLRAPERRGLPALHRADRRRQQVAHLSPLRRAAEADSHTADGRGQDRWVGRQRA
jgi:3-phytase